MNIDYKNKYLKYKTKYLSIKNNMQGGSDKIDVILFKAEWCGYCKKFSPTWERVKDEYKNKYNFVTYDSDKNKNEIKEWGVNGFPSIYFKKGDKVIEYTGSREYDNFVQMLLDL